MALALAGCGSGNSGGSDAMQVSGRVVDGPIQGAVVFLDLNNNLVADEGEPISTPTAADGSFLISIGRLSAAQLATATFVTHVPITASDADDRGKTLGEAGRKAFSLMAPAAASIGIGSSGSPVASASFISPLTTLVADEVLRNGLTLDEAKATVRRALALANDPVVDFLDANDSDMRSKARQLADAFGRVGETVAVAQQAGDGAAGERLRKVIEIIRKDFGAYVSGAAPTSYAGVQAVDGVQVPPPAPDVSTLSASPGFVDYLVMLQSGAGAAATSNAVAAAVSAGGQVKHVFQHAIKGMSVRVPSSAAAAFVAAMARDGNVVSVEDDVRTKATAIEANAPWGLDRSDQTDLPLSTTYGYTFTGNGVRAYVVDTGILAGHADFGGRVAAGYSVVADGRGTSDCNGHGTHVSGIIGGSTWGVAKNVTLVPVRVFDCTGSAFVGDVIAGLDWIMDNAPPPAVVNMSLENPKSLAMDYTVQNLVAAGFVVVVAAGNDNANACNYSPAGEPSVITVGATTRSDARASYSNYGSCVDLFAPGDMITSTWNLDTASTATLSGTSMASPHVAGLVALVLEVVPTAKPPDVANFVVAVATTGKITDLVLASADRLMYIPGTSQNPPPPPPPPPVAVSIANLTGRSTLRPSASSPTSWLAMVTVTVSDAKGVLVGGATVTGTFTRGGLYRSCTTGSNGTCTVTSGHIPLDAAKSTFSVTDVTGTGLTYDPAANSASAIVVQMPAL